MAELAAATEVYPPPQTIKVWKTLLNWLAFFFRIFSQILRGTPQVLSYVGLRHSSLLSSNTQAPPQYKPLPVVQLSEIEEESQETPSTPPAAVPIAGVGGRVTDAPPFEKLTVVLDLDETLVCAYETLSLPAIIRAQATEAGLKWFELECISSEKDVEGKPKINYVTVFERPGLKEFLKQLSEFADLILFTAGLEGYARPLVDRLDVENLFTNRLYRPSTISTEYREHVKDLSCISKDLCRVVIVDNNPFSFLLQPLNGIPRIPFSAGQPRDEQVPGITLEKCSLTLICPPLITQLFLYVPHSAFESHPSTSQASFSAERCKTHSV